jgi:iron complex outermembrane receptor protein
MFKKKKIHTMICASLMASVTAWASGEAALEEVIVTAQKRAENVQDVPISIQTLNAVALERNVIVSLTDMRAQAPGVTINNFPLAQESTLLVNMRGSQPFSTAVTLDQPVAIHLNGIYLARSDGLNSVTAADLERVEILKGPQGTLVGRNAASGAINIVTAKPTFDGFHFKQQVTVATRDQLTTKTAVNLPLTETLAARISYLHKNVGEPANGIKNSGPGPELGTSKTDAWRLDFRWQPTNNVTVDYG